MKLLAATGMKLVSALMAFLWVVAAIAVVLWSGRLGVAGATEPDALWDVEDVAAFLGVSPATVRYWEWTGTGPRSFKIGRRRKWKPSDVKKWAESGAKEPGPKTEKAFKAVKSTRINTEARTGGKKPTDAAQGTGTRKVTAEARTKKATTRPSRASP
jgi:predicted DNA-binding transcriptional regulator AlpA